ncbi:hypothetical protein PV325_012630 [Microctonus aethiopoides]|uniref:Luciferin 4-monooxygenase n=1 Tax=Microctonus aethiopoides TaxID=144406 RepID=A0AA39C573_9HYME|nr:hypothetical protein PV325_012630 [Microctonus aethiopoides]KAK0157819.1 hypothetical protein PV328_011509 [Microctonus aethiopoides]
MEKILRGPKGFKVPNVSYGEFIYERLRNAPERVVQIDAKSGETLTNHDLLKQSVILSKELMNKNIKINKTIMISSENSNNYFIAVCATIFTGACISPINPAYLEEEIRHCLNISKPQIIFVSRNTEKLIHRIVKSMTSNIELIQLDNDTELNGIDTIHNIINNSKEFLIDNDLYNFKPEKIPRPFEQEVVILYSSGTTGLPKGVMLSSRNLLALWYAKTNIVFAKHLEDAIYLILLPFFHGYGFSLMMFIITVGAQAIVMKSFQPELFCESIEKYRVTTIPLVPPIMVFLAKHPLVSKYNFDSVKDLICGAAPLPIDVRKAVQERLGKNINIRNGYGMTELTVVTSVSPNNPKNIETIGCLFPGIDCKVIDPETSKSLGKHKTGELCFRGDFTMLGYKGDPEATSQTIDNNGWLHTGDLGYYDHDGYLYVVGRLKELIKFNGFQIAPAEIENLLLTHVDVNDAAVFGQDHEAYGQIPVALVVLKPNATSTPEQLCKFINDRVSPQKYLRGGVTIVKSIPKNPSGKILRRELHKLVSKL